MFVKTKKIVRNRFDSDLYEEVRYQFRSGVSYEEFHGCCGVYELCGFDNISDIYHTPRYRPYVIKYFKEEFTWGARAVAVATLAEYQYKDVGPVLRALGFKKASEGKNEGHRGNNITVYTKVVTPPRKGKR
jgi:hypothetical protein